MTILERAYKHRDNLNAQGTQLQKILEKTIKPLEAAIDRNTDNFHAVVDFIFRYEGLRGVSDDEIRRKSYEHASVERHDPVYRMLDRICSKNGWDEQYNQAWKHRGQMLTRTMDEQTYTALLNALSQKQKVA